MIKFKHNNSNLLSGIQMFTSFIVCLSKSKGLQRKSMSNAKSVSAIKNVVLTTQATIMFFSKMKINGYECAITNNVNR